MNFIQWLFSLISNIFKKPVTNIPDRSFDNDVIIDKNDWVVESQTSDVNNKCLKVVYREKYGGELTIYCMVIFRNDKTQQYKFVASWLKNEIIERSNITGIIVTEVPKEQHEKNI